MSFGRLMVTLQPGGPLCVAVPPGHTAAVKTPPVLLVTWKVKSWLGHLQRPPLHELVWQSPFATQVAPSPQAPQLGPPQSTSLSPPFLTPSEHVGAWQTPLTHTPLWPSPPLEQPPPVPHAAHGPPQSMPVSPPFCAPSLHDGA